MSSTPVLLDIGSRAYAHQAEVDRVKAQLGITHNYFDCWIYGFLENKNFNVSEAVAKLRRRDEFEKTELAAYEMTTWMYENMQRGIIQVIGNDKQGRVTFYIVTARDKPQTARRDESRRTFDMFVSYGTRLRPESKRCQMAMLINQDKASMWGNLDMTFQADIALRIAKYYPGAIDKMYICNMGRTLAAFAKPIFSRLPSIVSDRIQIITEGDIKNGALLEHYDAAVLPVALGGRNACDRPENYVQFANVIRDYFADLQRAVRRGRGVKEWELETLRTAGYIAEDVPQLEMLRRTMTVGGGNGGSNGNSMLAGSDNDEAADAASADAAAAAATDDDDANGVVVGDATRRRRSIAPPPPRYAAAESVVYADEDSALVVVPPTATTSASAVSTAAVAGLPTRKHVDVNSTHSGGDKDGDGGALSTYSIASAGDAHRALAAATAATMAGTHLARDASVSPSRASGRASPLVRDGSQWPQPLQQQHQHHNSNNNGDGVSAGDDEDEAVDLFTCDALGVSGVVAEATVRAMQWPPPPPPASSAVTSLTTTVDLMRSLRLSTRTRSEVCGEKDRRGAVCSCGLRNRHDGSGAALASPACAVHGDSFAYARHSHGGHGDGDGSSHHDKGNDDDDDDDDVAGGDLFADYAVQFATLEAFFRINLQEMHAREWLQLVRDEMSERQRLLVEADEVHGEQLLRGLPPTLYVVAKGFLWMCLMVMALYFLASTIFLVLLGVTTLVYLFFAMFTSPYNVFLYGTALVVTAGQFVVCCSRGFDLTRNTYHCRLIQALRAFGNRAHVCQIAVSVVCVLVCFIVFCVNASRHGVLAGVQYSVTIGWIISACLIVLYHFLFAFGLRTMTTPSYARGSRVNHAETTLYLFLNVDLDEEQLRSRSSAEVLVPSLLAAVAFAAGMAYLCGAGFFFLAALLVVQSALLLLCTVVLCRNNASSSSSLVVCGVCYASVFWVDVVFTMSRYGWTTPWSHSLLAVLFVMLFFLVLGFVAVYGPWKAGRLRSWLFRLSWLFVLAHFAACVIVLLVRNYRVGLFVFALGVHLVLTNFRVSESGNTYGMFAIALGFLAALLTCCLLGRYAYGERYSGDALPWLSANTTAAATTATTTTTTTTRTSTWPSSALDARSSDALATLAGQLLRSVRATTLVHTALSTLPPICLVRFPLPQPSSGDKDNNSRSDNTRSSVNVFAMALLAKIGYNTDAAGQRRDVQRWLPELDVQETVLASQWGAMDVTVFTSRRRSNNNDNNNGSTDTMSTTGTTPPVTVLAVRPSVNMQAVIEAMTMWLEGYTVAVFSGLVPEQYSAAVASALSFMRDMVPLLWRTRTAADMTTLLSRYVDGDTTADVSTAAAAVAVSNAATRIASPPPPQQQTGGYVYVVGSGPSGTTAALIVAKLLSSSSSSSAAATARRVRAVVFAPTQVQHTSLVGGIAEATLAQSALFVNTLYSLYDPLFAAAAYTQILPCSANDGACDRLDTMLRTLYTLCSVDDDSSSSGGDGVEAVGTTR